MRGGEWDGQDGGWELPDPGQSWDAEHVEADDDGDDADPAGDE